MRNIKNKAKQYVKRDGGTILPIFKKNENGEYESIGQTEVVTLKELKEYFETYSEIAKLIKENYKKEIVNIYKGALDSLIFTSNERNGYLFQEYLNGFSDDQVNINDSFSGYELYDRTMSRIFSGSVFAKKRIKPCKEIVELMKNPVNEGAYLVLPQMTENGVVVVPDKNLNSIAVKFNKYSLEHAKAIKNYMLETAYQIEDPELASMVYENINALFETSMAGNVNELDKKTLLSKLAEIAIKLVGTDLTPFEKRKVINSNASNNTQISKEGQTKNKTMALSSNPEKQIKAYVGGGEEKINTILIDGLNLINQRQNTENGNIVTIISPANGMSYKIEFVGQSAVFTQNQDSEIQK